MLVYTYGLQNLTVACTTTQSFSQENTEPGTMLIQYIKLTVVFRLLTTELTDDCNYFEHIMCHREYDILSPDFMTWNVWEIFNTVDEAWTAVRTVHREVNLELISKGNKWMETQHMIHKMKIQIKLWTYIKTSCGIGHFFAQLMKMDWVPGEGAGNLCNI